MNPETFFENLDLLCEAPNSIAKLRELILQLAVQGKLVPQDPNDESASISLEIIKAEKKKTDQDGKTKGSKLVSSKNFDQIPYEIPSNWEWSTLSECGLINPRNDISDESEVSFIPMTCISEKYGQNVEMEIKKWEEIKKGFTHFAENDVVLAKITPCFQNGKSAVMKGLKNGFGAGTTELHVFRPLKELIIPNYVLIYLKSPDFIYDGIPKMTGSAGQKRIPKNYFSENPFPLPPLAEQKRIVSKVDELMALCDKLETRRQKKQELQSKLNSAALDRMLSAENQEEFEQYWQRICENFDLLYDNPENVEKLKQAILQLAVQGKLVPQNPEDEPASVLIEKIIDEKKNLVKFGKIKETKSSSLEITDNIPLFPESWELVNLDSIILFMDAGWSPACKNHPTEDEQTWGVLKTTSVQPLTFLWTEHKELPENLTPRPEYEVRVGDILITRAGPKNRVGICCLVKDTRSRLMISDKIIRFHLLDEFVFPEFIALCLNTGFSQSFIESQKSGMAESQMNISQNKLRMTPIPIPPLNEQKRIVEKVEQFMGLCDELEAKLRKSRENGEILMETVVRGLLEGAAAEI